MNEKTAEICARLVAFFLRFCYNSKEGNDGINSTKGKRFMKHLQNEKTSYLGSSCFSTSEAVCTRTPFYGVKRVLSHTKSV